MWKGREENESTNHAHHTTGNDQGEQCDHKGNRYRRGPKRNIPWVESQDNKMSIHVILVVHRTTRTKP